MYAAFRPFWSFFSDNTPQKSLGNPAWCGWGEEVMIVGRKLDRMMAQENGTFLPKGTKPTLYCFYPGDYLTWSGTPAFNLKYVLKDSADYQGDVERFMGKLGKTTVRSNVVFDSASLFLFNRFNLIVDSYEIPPKTKPIYTLSYRGYPMAWLYRGDELKNSGFSF